MRVSRRFIVSVLSPNWDLGMNRIFDIVYLRLSNPRPLLDGLSLRTVMSENRPGETNALERHGSGTSVVDMVLLLWSWMKCYKNNLNLLNYVRSATFVWTYVIGYISVYKTTNNNNIIVSVKPDRRSWCFIIYENSKGT